VTAAPMPIIVDSLGDIAFRLKGVSVAGPAWSVFAEPSAFIRSNPASPRENYWAEDCALSVMSPEARPDQVPLASSSAKKPVLNLLRLGLSTKTCINGS
jgi:hypothetical protein